jgi:hypothetical protein
MAAVATFQRGRSWPLRGGRADSAGTETESDQELAANGWHKLRRGLRAGSHFSNDAGNEIEPRYNRCDSGVGFMPC